MKLRARLVITLLTAIASFALAATASALPPAVNLDASDPGAEAGSIDFSGEVDPDGQDFEWRFEYFEKTEESICFDHPVPDPVMATPWILSTDHSSSVIVSTTVTELPYEVDYCARLVAKNADSIEPSASPWWGAYTEGPAPELGDWSVEGSSADISYTVDLIPNSNNYFASIQAQYFVKPDEVSCGNFEGTISEANNWGQYMDPINWDGWKGFEEVTEIPGVIDGVGADTVYCIRLIAISAYGEDVGNWDEIRTVTKQSALIGDADLLKPGASGPLDLSLTVNDRGAADDTGDPSSYELMVYDVGEGRCNEDEYFGGDLILSAGPTNFEGEEEIVVDAAALDPGKPYCLTTFVSSAWGEDYDAVDHQEILWGDDPEISNFALHADSDTAISYSVDVAPGYLPTGYGLFYFQKFGSGSCDDEIDRDYKDFGEGEITTNLDQSHTLGGQVTSLLPATTYCFGFWAENEWDGDSTNLFEVSTLTTPTTQPPSDPGTPAKQCFTKYKKTFNGRTKKGKKFKLTVIGTPAADGQSISFSVTSTQSKSVKPALYVSGKKSGKGAKVNGTGLVSVKYTSGKKKKSANLQYARVGC